MLAEHRSIGVGEKQQNVHFYIYMYIFLVYTTEGHFGEKQRFRVSLQDTVKEFVERSLGACAC